MTLIHADKVVRESLIENRLVKNLTPFGFKVLKLTTPGTSHTPDRLILRPKWSPGPPWVIEAKRPGKNERRAQELTRDDWRARGVLVLDMVDTYEKVDALVTALVDTCRDEAPVRKPRPSSCTDDYKEIVIRPFPPIPDPYPLSVTIDCWAIGGCNDPRTCMTNGKCHVVT